MNGTSTRLRRDAGLGRWLLLGLVLLAFLVQGYVAQSHVHIPGHAVEAGASHAAHGQAPHKKSLGGDTDDCPACQMVAQHGAYIAPAGYAVLRFAAGFVPPLEIVITLTRAFEIEPHDWRGRAPPAR